MRYPGKAHDERYWRTLAFASALVIFVGGLGAAKIKIDANVPADQPAVAVTRQPSPTPTELAIRFRLTDQKTGQAIARQEVTFYPAMSCELPTTCNATSPIKVTTDETGELIVSGDLVSQKPQLYVVGYKMDRYFTVLDPHQPNQISLYYVTTADKVTYDSEKEVVPVALIPVD